MSDTLARLEQAIEARRREEEKAAASRKEDLLDAYTRGFRLVKNFLDEARNAGIYQPLDDIVVQDVAVAIGEDFAKVTGIDKNVENRIREIMRGVLMKADKDIYYFPAPEEEKLEDEPDFIEALDETTDEAAR